MNHRYRTQAILAGQLQQRLRPGLAGVMLGLMVGLAVGATVAWSQEPPAFAPTFLRGNRILQQSETFRAGYAAGTIDMLAVMDYFAKHPTQLPHEWIPQRFD